MREKLTFEGVTLHTITINGQDWVNGNQIGSCLELSFPDKAIAKIFKRNRHQFTPEMTTAIELPTATGVRLTRVYSPRGVALLCLLSRSPVADRFRAFVLDRLESGNTDDGALLARTQAALLVARPDLARIRRYLDLGLAPWEIRRLLGCSDDTLRRRRREMEALGLIAAPANLAALQAQAVRLLPPAVGREG